MCKREMCVRERGSVLFLKEMSNRFSSINCNMYASFQGI